MHSGLRQKLQKKLRKTHTKTQTRLPQKFQAGLVAVVTLGTFTVFATVFTASSAFAKTDKAELDSWKATDAELTAAVGQLDKDIATHQSDADAATQAVEAADHAIALADLRIASLEQRKSEITALATQMALNEYMQPTNGFMTQMFEANGVADADRRVEIINEINGKNFNVVDELRAVNRDLVREQKSQTEAKNASQARQSSAQAALVELRKSRDEKAKLDTDLKARIAAAQAEDQVSRSPAPETANMSVSASGLRWPIDGSPKIVSPFGGRWGGFHPGVDIAAPMGTPVRAVKGGVVTYAGWEGGYGNYVCVQHGGGFQTCDGHNSRIVVSVGQHVSQGDLLSYSGSTGYSTGPHLHFETCASTGPSCIYGTMKNPQDFLP